MLITEELAQVSKFKVPTLMVGDKEAAQKALSELKSFGVTLVRDGKNRGYVHAGDYELRLEIADKTWEGMKTDSAKFDKFRKSVSNYLTAAHGGSLDYSTLFVYHDEDENSFVVPYDLKVTTGIVSEADGAPAEAPNANDKGPDKAPSAEENNIKPEFELDVGALLYKAHEFAVKEAEKKKPGWFTRQFRRNDTAKATQEAAIYNSAVVGNRMGCAPGKYKISVDVPEHRKDQVAKDIKNMVKAYLSALGYNGNFKLTLGKPKETGYGDDKDKAMVPVEVGYEIKENHTNPKLMKESDQPDGTPAAMFEKVADGDTEGADADLEKIVQEKVRGLMGDGPNEVFHGFQCN